MLVKLNFAIPKGVAKVVFSDEIGETPANCNLRTRIIKVNPLYWKKLNNDQRFYVIAHEAGHINLQTHSEFEADQYASELYLESGRSPKQSVFAISKVLPLENYDQRKRLELQLERAAEYDYGINNNNNALKILKIMNENLDNELDEYEYSFLGDDDDDDDDDNFKGKGKARREAKRAAKATKKADKNTRKNTKANSKAAARDKRSEAKLIKSQGGDDSGSGNDIFGKAMEGLKQVGDTVGQIRGKSVEGEEGSEGGSQDGSRNAEGDKLIMGIKAGTFYVIAGVVAVVVCVGLWLAFKPKKKQTA